MKTKLPDAIVGSFVLIGMFGSYRPEKWRVQQVLWTDAEGVFLEGEEDDHYSRSYHANSWNNIIAFASTPDELLEMKNKAEAIYARFFVSYETTNEIMRAEIAKELRIKRHLYSLKLCPICQNCNSEIPD